MARVLVTGSNGFIGTYLCDLLESKNHVVIRDRNLLPGFDLCHDGSVFQLIEKAAPDAVVHLAAQSYPSLSWSWPKLTFQCNLNGTLHLLEAIRTITPKARVVVASSSAIYGGDNVPLKEDHALQPCSPYAASKAAMEMLAFSYFHSYETDIVIARIFGTTGIGKSRDVCNEFIERIVRQEDPLRVGNTGTIRDLTDVKDTVQALSLLLEKGKTAEVYNISQGRGYMVQRILEIILEIVGEERTIKVDESLFRFADETMIVGDNTKIRGLGWKPQISLHETLEEIINVRSCASSN